MSKEINEALKCLERLEYYHKTIKMDLGCREHRLKDLDTIKQTLIQADKDKKLLDILKLCGETRSYELQIYLSNRTDCDIGNGIAEYEAFDIVKEWLDNE